MLSSYLCGFVQIFDDNSCFVYDLAAKNDSLLFKNLEMGIVCKSADICHWTMVVVSHISSHVG